MLWLLQSLGMNSTKIFASFIIKRKLIVVNLLDNTSLADIEQHHWSRMKEISG